MAQNSWPSPSYNSRSVTDLEYEKLSARFSDDGVYGSPADSAVVTAGTGLTVNVRAGVYASVRGHAWTSGTSTVSLPVGANSSGQTRIDRVVLQLDRSTWNVQAIVKPGTPGAGPPALSQQTGDTGTYEIPLAQVTVINNATAVTVTREELYVGSRTRACTSTTRNPNPARGEECFETDTGRWMGWNGTSWVTLYEDTGQLPIGAGWSTWEAFGDNIAQKRSGIVELRLAVRRKDSTFTAADADGSQIGVLPAAIRPSRFEYGSGQFNNGASCRIEVRTDGTVWAKYASKDVPAGYSLLATITYLA
ncbi:hypothetical protein [Streptomyces mexicanus]|uniref:hypothetical protein n=1 Tax=Streptomyces mexicanus TaxID=178566 RepID=UPI00365FC602